MRLTAAVLSILGGTAEEIRTNTPLGRVYAAYHAALVQMGHATQWPGVMAARNRMAERWMTDTITAAKSTPIEGVAILD